MLSGSRKTRDSAKNKRFRIPQNGFRENKTDSAIVSGFHNFVPPIDRVSCLKKKTRARKNVWQTRNLKATNESITGIALME